MFWVRGAHVSADTPYVVPQAKLLFGFGDDEVPVMPLSEDWPIQPAGVVGLEF